jgi:hypothetical protein
VTQSVAAAGYQVEQSYAYCGVQLLVVSGAPAAMGSPGNPGSGSAQAPAHAELRAAGAWRLAESVQPAKVRAQARISAMSRFSGVSYVALESRGSLAQAQAQCPSSGEAVR